MIGYWLRLMAWKIKEPVMWRDSEAFWSLSANDRRMIYDREEQGWLADKPVLDYA